MNKNSWTYGGCFLQLLGGILFFSIVGSNVIGAIILGFMGAIVGGLIVVRGQIIAQKEKVMQQKQQEESELQSMKEYASKINKLVDNITSFQDVNIDCTTVCTMLTNFIIKNVVYMLTTQNILVFEKIILEQSELGKELLLSKDMQLNKIDIPENIINDTIMYKSNQFNPLTKALAKYIPFSNDTESVYTTYALLKKVSIVVFSTHWESQYPNIFDDITSMSIDQIISRFCLIEDVKNHDYGGLTAVLTCYLLDKNVITDKNYLQALLWIIDLVEKCLEEMEQEDFEKSLLGLKIQQETKYSINDIDLMSGREFEEFIGTLFSNMGYTVEVTKASGDQGIDIIAIRDGIKIGIQTKCYGGVVSNKAVQEVVGAIIRRIK